MLVGTVFYVFTLIFCVLADEETLTEPTVTENDEAEITTENPILANINDVPSESSDVGSTNPQYGRQPEVLFTPDVGVDQLPSESSDGSPSPQNMRTPEVLHTPEVRLDKVPSEAAEVGSLSPQNGPPEVLRTPEVGLDQVPSEAAEVGSPSPQNGQTPEVRIDQVPSESADVGSPSPQNGPTPDVLFTPVPSETAEVGSPSPQNGQTPKVLYTPVPSESAEFGLSPENRRTPAVLYTPEVVIDQAANGESEVLCQNADFLAKILNVILPLLAKNVSGSKKTTYILQILKELLKSSPQSIQNDEVLFKMNDLLQTLEKYDLGLNNGALRTIDNDVGPTDVVKSKISFKFEIPAFTNPDCTAELLTIIKVVQAAISRLVDNPVCKTKVKSAVVPGYDISSILNNPTKHIIIQEMFPITEVPTIIYSNPYDVNSIVYPIETISPEVIVPGQIVTETPSPYYIDNIIVPGKQETEVYVVQSTTETVPVNWNPTYDTQPTVIQDERFITIPYPYTNEPYPTPTDSPITIDVDSRPTVENVPIWQRDITIIDENINVPDVLPATDRNDVQNIPLIIDDNTPKVIDIVKPIEEITEEIIPHDDDIYYINPQNPYHYDASPTSIPEINGIPIFPNEINPSTENVPVYTPNLVDDLPVYPENENPVIWNPGSNDDEVPNTPYGNDQWYTVHDNNKPIYPWIPGSYIWPSIYEAIYKRPYLPERENYYLNPDYLEQYGEFVNYPRPWFIKGQEPESEYHVPQENLENIPPQNEYDIYELPYWKRIYYNIFNKYPPQFGETTWEPPAEVITPETAELITDEVTYYPPTDNLPWLITEHEQIPYTPGQGGEENRYVPIQETTLPDDLIPIDITPWTPKYDDEPSPQPINPGIPEVPTVHPWSPGTPELNIIVPTEHYPIYPSLPNDDETTLQPINPVMPDIPNINPIIPDQPELNIPVTTENYPELPSYIEPNPQPHNPGIPDVPQVYPWNPDRPVPNYDNDVIFKPYPIYPGQDEINIPSPYPFPSPDDQGEIIPNENQPIYNDEHWPTIYENIYNKPYQYEIPYEYLIKYPWLKIYENEWHTRPQYPGQLVYPQEPENSEFNIIVPNENYPIIDETYPWNIPVPKHDEEPTLHPVNPGIPDVPEVNPWNPNQPEIDYFIPTEPQDNLIDVNPFRPTISDHIYPGLPIIGPEEDYPIPKYDKKPSEQPLNPGIPDIPNEPQVNPWNRDHPIEDERYPWPPQYEENNYIYKPIYPGIPDEPQVYPWNPDQPEYDIIIPPKKYPTDDEKYPWPPQYVEPNEVTIIPGIPDVSQVYPGTLPQEENIEIIPSPTPVPQYIVPEKNHPDVNSSAWWRLIYETIAKILNRHPKQQDFVVTPTPDYEIISEPNIERVEAITQEVPSTIIVDNVPTVQTSIDQNVLILIRDNIGLIEHKVPQILLNIDVVQYLQKIKQLISLQTISVQDYATIVNQYEQLIAYIKKLNINNEILNNLLVSVTNVNKSKQLGKSNIIELTYLVKRPKPLVYQPYYYVKYRLPYTSFLARVQQLLVDKPYLKSDPVSLYKELIALSNVSETSPDLKQYEKEDIFNLTYSNGTLLDAKVVKGEDADMYATLDLLKEINSDISLDEAIKLIKNANKDKLNEEEEMALNELESGRDDLNVKLKVDNEGIEKPAITSHQVINEVLKRVYNLRSNNEVPSDMENNLQDVAKSSEFVTIPNNEEQFTATTPKVEPRRERNSELNDLENQQSDIADKLDSVITGESKPIETQSLDYDYSPLDPKNDIETTNLYEPQLQTLSKNMNTKLSGVSSNNFPNNAFRTEYNYAPMISGRPDLQAKLLSATMDAHNNANHQTYYQNPVNSGFSDPNVVRYQYQVQGSPVVYHQTYRSPPVMYQQKYTYNIPNNVQYYVKPGQYNLGYA